MARRSYFRTGWKSTIGLDKPVHLLVRFVPGFDLPCLGTTSHPECLDGRNFANSARHPTDVERRDDMVNVSTRFRDMSWIHPPRPVGERVPIPDLPGTV